MLMRYNKQSWPAINPSSEAFFLHLAHALMAVSSASAMASPGSLFIPWWLHLQRLLTIRRSLSWQATIVEVVWLTFSLTCLQHNFLAMQLQMLLGLETHIAQGLGLLPYNKHSEIEICAEAVSALLLGVQQMQLMVKSFLLCTPDRLHKLCDARRSALFASLFHGVAFCKSQEMIWQFMNAFLPPAVRAVPGPSELRVNADVSAYHHDH